MGNNEKPCCKSYKYIGRHYENLEKINSTSKDDWVAIYNKIRRSDEDYYELDHIMDIGTKRFTITNGEHYNIPMITQLVLQ